MATKLTVFTLYKTISSVQDSNEFILVRTTKPGYPNYNANLDHLSDEIEYRKRQLILATIAHGHILNQIMIGQFQGIPVGEMRYLMTTGLKIYR